MVRIPRCEVCGEPISTCGGCGFMQHVTQNQKTFYGNPPEKFEMDKDLYNSKSFKRKIKLAEKRRKQGLNVPDRYQDKSTIYLQCPYEECATWFPVPVEYTRKRSKLYAEYLECPCCWQVSRARKKGKLEKV